MAMLLGLLLATACSANSPHGGREAAAAAEPRPQGRDARFVSHADDGTTLSMRVGETRTLWSADPATPDPLVSGDAVQLVAMVSIQDSGDRSWELRAVRPGRSQLTVGGTMPFKVMVEVAPAPWPDTADQVQRGQPATTRR